MTAEPIETSVIYREDNLTALSRLPSESVDLVYLDPPFFSNRNYEVIWGDEAEVRSFEDRWTGGITHYTGWMRQRMTQIHRLLKPSGSVYLHCDPHASHYLKVMMDETFGPSRFQNEVIWKRSSAHNSAKRFGPVHDVILFYSKGERFTWNPVYQPLPQETIDQWYNNVEDGSGRRYNRADLTAAGVREGSSGQPWRGIDPSAKNRHWAIPGFVGDLVKGLSTQEALDALDAGGRLHWPKRRNGMPMLKRYVEESKGIPAQDVITDIRPLNNVAAERLGYPTQKPEALLERLILASSNRGDVVLDPFCGCGTAVAVAEQHLRRWVGIDISPTAVNIMKRRLGRVTAKPVRVVGDPETEEALRDLKPFEFQNWVIQKFVGTHSPRKSGDMGIDGYSFMVNHPIQVKRSDRVGRNVVDNFETAMRRGGHSVGYIVAFSFTKNAREEVARAKWSDGLEVRLVTVRELLMPTLDEWIPELASVSQLPLPPSRPPADLPTAQELIASDTA